MYAIYKNGKKTVRQLFDTYEHARQYARKLARKTDSVKQYLVWSSNPALGIDFGYSIRRV
jgi:hypothetical protein